MAKARNELKDIRQFSWVLSGILTVLGVVNLFKHRVSWSYWLFGLGIITALMILTAPKLLRPVYLTFTKIAHAIGWFNTRAILILIYYMLITPIALIMRIFREDPLDRKIEKNAASYWVKRAAAGPIKEGLQRQF
ncbi:MAG: SxtJ family membrane protein [Candidatus Omnitrophica bacterium]|nr:SxtJ family membrane protein [Candidatus Omnitrophota bacterium]MDD5436728.1 SxtJ family membrane protein [Candidatus Omnitrophota bacterium]